MTSLEFVLAFLEDLFNCRTDTVGKLSDLRTTLGSTKGALDEVLVGLKWVVKLEDVVQNAGSSESRSKCHKVFGGGEGASAEVGEVRLKIQLVVESFVGKQNQEQLESMHGG